MLRIEDLTLHYGQSQILNGVTLSAEAGQVTCLMGTNGVGKTSLLKAISGRHRRSGGIMNLDGKPIPASAAHVMARHGVAYVPQGREIFPLMTVRENLETGFALLPRANRAVPDEIYELVPGPRRHVQPTRGGPLWRSTATACHRAGPGAQTETAVAG